MHGIEPDAIRLIVNFDPKERFELKDGKIRARYGHTIDVKTEWSEAPILDVPSKLYLQPSKISNQFWKGGCYQ